MFGGLFFAQGYFAQGPGNTEPIVPADVAITGTYTPDVAVTGTFAQDIAVTGTYAPNVDVTGEY